MNKESGWLGVLALAVTLAACGGEAFTDPPGGGAGAGGSGGEQYLGGCPQQNPPEGTACPKKELTCSYGDHFDPECREQVRCMANGKWRHLTKPNKVSCDPSQQPEPCPKGEPPPDKDQCDGQFADALVCSYADQRVMCACRSMDCSGGMCQPLEHPSWICQGPPADKSCPVDMPNAGTACGQTDQICDYLGGGCSGGVTMECRDGIWQIGDLMCPA